MILNKIKLSDFISHKNTELELGYGINVVVGPNGAGKTSILDAISFALFSDYSNRGKKENLINSKANKCKAAVEFSEGGVKYAVEWSMDRGKSAKGSLYRVQNGDRTLLAQGGSNVVVPEVEKILGIDKSMFLQSVYVRQGEIEQLVTSTSAARKELISKLLGVEDLQKAWESIRFLIDEYEATSNKLEGELTQKPGVEDDKKKHLETKQEMAKKIESKGNELQKTEGRIAELQTLLEQLKENKKTFEKLDKEKNALQKDIENGKRKLENEQTELDRSVKAEEKVRSLEGDVGKLRFLEEYTAAASQKREHELQRDGLKEKLTNLERLMKSLHENEADHGSYLEKDNLLKEKTGERKRLEGAGDALKRVLKQVQQFEKTEQKKATELERELEKFAKILGVQVTVDNVEAVLESKRKEFRSVADELGRKVDGNREKMAFLANKKKELDDSVSKLEASKTAVTTCPTCETELPPGRVSQLLNKFRSERTKTEAELKQAETGLTETAESQKQADEKLQRALSIDVENVKGITGELLEAKNQAQEHKMEAQGLEERAKALEQLDNGLARLEAEKQGLAEAYHEFESAKRELAKLPSREQIDGEMAPVLEALETVCGRLKEAVLNLGYEPEEPDEELITLRLKKQEYDQNLPVAERRSEHEEKVAKTRKDLTCIEQKLGATVDAIEKLGYDEEHHTRRQSDFDSAKGERSGLKEKIAGLAAQEKDAEAGALECDRKLQVLEKKEQEKHFVDSFIGLLNKIRNAYGKDGVQKTIRAQARPVLERSTRDLFERFNLAYSDIKIDDDYNISVIGPAGEEDIAQISGGERVALAIALRLAIAQVLSGRVETIIMDEPTTHLDEERRKELVNILSSFFREGGRIIPQMLIITHHPEIVDVADVIYSVRKEDDRSIAELGQHASPHTPGE